MTTATGKRTLSLREVAELFGVTEKTVRTWVKEGRFPRPLRASPRKFLWPEEVVERALMGEYPRREGKQQG